MSLDIRASQENVTFVASVFDLVFVFSVTQVVGLLHGGLNWFVAGHLVLVFWLVNSREKHSTAWPAFIPTTPRRRVAIGWRRKGDQRYSVPANSPAVPR